MGRLHENLKVYREALTGFSRVYCPDGLNHTLLSQGCVLGQLLTWPRQAQCMFPGQGRRWGTRVQPEGQQEGGHALSMIFSNNLLKPNQVWIPEVWAAVKLLLCLSLRVSASIKAKQNKNQQVETPGNQSLGLFSDACDMSSGAFAGSETGKVAIGAACHSQN